MAARKLFSPHTSALAGHDGHCWSARVGSGRVMFKLIVAPVAALQRMVLRSTTQEKERKEAFSPDWRSYAGEGIVDRLPLGCFFE